MTAEPHNSVEVFYSYAHEDEKLRDELVKHLANLRRQGVITEWYDRDISAGKEWEGEIKQHLDSARVILLLISPDFMNSDYSNDVEVKRAMERHEAGDARVIPIILRPVDWEGAPFSKLQALPTDAKPVTSWDDPDEAFLSVVKAIRKALEEQPEEVRSGLTLPANIPRPPNIGFVARRDGDGRDIVERLKEELAPQKNQLIALSGPGGVGKTTLAAEVTRALSESFGQRIVWTSALGREDFALSTLLDEIATQLGHPEIRPLALEPKAEQVQVLIASAPPLIILDNFETIPEAAQTRCVEFLMNRASCPALITTRQRIALARNITIPVMSPEEADAFLGLLISQAGDPSAFAQLDRDRIMQASERNPLIMQWVIGQIELAQDAETVLDELAHGVGDAAQRVFDRSFGLEQLGDDGRALLLALSLFAPDASRAALAAVAGFGDDVKRLNEAVKRLASLWLVKSTAAGSRLTVTGLTRELAKARFTNDGGADEYRRRFIAHFVSYAKVHAQPTPEDYDALEVEKGNVLSAMDVAVESRDGHSLMLIMNALGKEPDGFFDIRGYWDEAAKRGEQAITAAQANKNESAVAVFAGNIAIIRQRRGEYDEARRAHQKALDSFRRLGDEQNVAVASHQLAILAQDQGELEEARRLYKESLEINKKLGNQSGIAASLNELGRLARNQGQVIEARQFYKESLEINNRLGNQNIIAVTLLNLAILAQDQGELEEARRLYNESLEINKKLGHQSGIASCLNELGRLAQNQSEVTEARRFYDESLEISKRLGDQGCIAVSLHNLGRLAEDEGDNTEAARLFREALTILKKLKSPYAELARASLARVDGKSS
jgi:tetratricopeptide (TPR) repeat protein